MAHALRFCGIWARNGRSRRSSSIRPIEALVRLTATGLCHSDEHRVTGVAS